VLGLGGRPVEAVTRHVGSERMPRGTWSSAIDRGGSTRLRRSEAPSQKLADGLAELLGGKWLRQEGPMDVWHRLGSWFRIGGDEQHGGGRPTLGELPGKHGP
jgi:hypothetical protein